MLNSAIFAARGAKLYAEDKTMSEQKKIAMMPFYVHEITVTRFETIIKRLTWACIAGWIITALSVAAAIIW